MSLMVFDDSKIEKIKNKNQKQKQKENQTITVNPPSVSEDVVEASKNAKGGSELIYQKIGRASCRERV